jgi:CheY-like chemotaxis protein
MIGNHREWRVPRHQIYVLSDGTFAVQQADEAFQDLLTGASRVYTPKDLYHSASDFELAQLKLAGIVQEYDQSVALLYHVLENNHGGSGYSSRKREQGQLIDVDLLIASQTDTSALRGKLGIIACKDEHERRAIMSVLNALDMAVTSVSTAQEALNLLEEEPVDLLVMDVRFEDMHGWAMIGKLREIDHTVGTRLIVLAEQEVDEQVFALTVAKVDAYLPKPLSLPLLRQHVWALLKENAMDKPS